MLLRKPNPACVQSFTYTFAIDYNPTAEHRIPKPPSYERIRDSQPFGLRMNYPTEYGWSGTFTYSVFGEDPADSEQHVAEAVLSMAAPGGAQEL